MAELVGTLADVVKEAKRWLDPSLHEQLDKASSIDDVREVMKEAGFVEQIGERTGGGGATNASDKFLSWTKPKTTTTTQPPPLTPLRPATTTRPGSTTTQPSKGGVKGFSSGGVKELAPVEHVRPRTGSGIARQFPSKVPEGFSHPEGFEPQYEYDRAFNFWGLAGRPPGEEYLQAQLNEYIWLQAAPESVKEVFYQVMQVADLPFTRAEIASVLTEAKTATEAINFLYEMAALNGASDEAMKGLHQAVGVNATKEAGVGQTYGGAAASQEAISDRFQYEGEFAENHDWMVGERSEGGGGWLVQLDADNNLHYINPNTNEVIDTNDEYKGQWSPITGQIDFLTRKDARAPLGIPTGAYGVGQDANLVVGHDGGQMILTDWFNLYGNEHTDVVDGRQWDDVLRKSLGARGMLDYRKRLLHGAMSGAGPEVTDLVGLTTEAHYQYLEGEQVNMFINMPAEDFVRYQQGYEKMGVYKARMYGKFDREFIAIVKKTMEHANLDYEADPEGFDEVFNLMLENPGYASNLKTGAGGGTSRVWRPPAYLAPDYAEISQAVKTTFEQRMGRAPSDAEIFMLSKKMQLDHRGEFDAQAQAQKLQFFNSGGDDAGTVQDVNYAARFQEDFASKYQDELGTLDKIDASRNITQNALGSILAADRAAGY